MAMQSGQIPCVNTWEGSFRKNVCTVSSASHVSSTSYRLHHAQRATSTCSVPSAGKLDISTYMINESAR